MKRKYIIMLILLEILIGSLLIFNRVPIGFSQVGLEDIDYLFDRNICYEYSDDVNYTSWNYKGNISEYNYIYPSTWNHSLDTLGDRGMDIDFIDYNVTSSGCYSNLTVLDGRRVIELYDNAGVGNDRLYNNFSSSIDYGTMEFWVRTSDKSKRTLYRIDGIFNDVAIYWGIDNGWFYYKDNGGGDNNIRTLEDDTFYHIRISFDCDGGYLGLTADHFFIWINGERYGEYEFRNNYANVNFLQFQSEWGGAGYSSYISSIGYSWEGYNNGSNYVSAGDNLIYNSSYRYEFMHDSNGNVVSIGSSEFNEWDEIDVAGDKVKVADDPDESAFSDMTVWVYCDVVDKLGIEKDDFAIEDGIINFSIYITSLDMNNLNGYFHFDIYSYDSTLITRLRILYDGADYKLYWYDGASYNHLRDVTTGTTDNHIFNFYIDGFCYLNYTNIDAWGHVFNYKYVFDLIDGTKAGLSEIEVYGVMPDTTHIQFIYIDYIGVFIDNVPLSNDFFLFTYDIYGDGASSWDSLKHNLVFLNAFGYFSIYRESSLIIPMGFHNNTEEAYNLYWRGGFWGTFPIVDNTPELLFTANTSFTLNSLGIEGVILKENTTIYYPTYYNNTIPSYNFFYVENNRLRFSLFANTSDLEYMQVDFNINNYFTENYSFAYHSNLMGTLFSEIRLGFSDSTYSIFNIPSHPQSTRELISQEKFTDTLSILITDNDLVNGSMSGVFSGFALAYVYNIDLAITTTNLLAMLIPLAIMLFPSLILAHKKMFGKKALLPIFLLMAILCYIGELIPFWIVFILFYCFGALMIVRRERDGDL